MRHYEQVEQAAEAVRRRVGRRAPTVAIVLGSGLGGLEGALAGGVTVPYIELPNWPGVGVPGHEGRLIAGEVKGRAVIVLSGRSHAYEGHDLKTVTFAIRVLGLIGVSTLVLTNAAGSVNPRFVPGAFMVIDDHLNLMGGNPLVGDNDDRFGPRFPDLVNVYSERLRRIADEASRATGVALEHGVYAAVLGPSYETPAEIRYLRMAGADAVGMSTVPEAIVARHMGIEVLGITCIANMAAGVRPGPIDHRDVLETGRRVRGQFVALVQEIIGRV